MSDTPTADSLARVVMNARRPKWGKHKAPTPPLVVRFKGVAFQLADLAQDVDARLGLRLGINPADIRRKSQEKRLVRARHCAFAILKWGAGASSKQIGELYGRDHSTVLYGLDRVAARYRRERDTALISIVARELEREGWQLTRVRNGIADQAALVAWKDRQ